MAKTVKSDEFAQQVIDMMKSYTGDVKDAIANEVLNQGALGVFKLKNLGMPQATTSGTARPMTRRSWAKYSKGWVTEDVVRTDYASSTIHNKTHYRLVHLLEYGHATRDGKTTRAFAHVKPVEEERDAKLLENVKKIIEKGGKL